jgi:hypothetical protein
MILLEGVACKYLIFSPLTIPISRHTNTACNVLMQNRTYIMSCFGAGPAKAVSKRKVIESHDRKTSAKQSGSLEQISIS